MLVKGHQKALWKLSTTSVPETLPQLWKQWKDSGVSYMFSSCKVDSMVCSRVATGDKHPYRALLLTIALALLAGLLARLRIMQHSSYRTRYSLVPYHLRKIPVLPVARTVRSDLYPTPFIIEKATDEISLGVIRRIIAACSYCFSLTIMSTMGPYDPWSSSGGSSTKAGSSSYIAWHIRTSDGDTARSFKAAKHRYIFHNQSSAKVCPLYVSTLDASRRMYPPLFAENGDVVPVYVSSNRQDTETLKACQTFSFSSQSS